MNIQLYETKSNSSLLTSTMRDIYHTECFDILLKGQ